MAETALLVAAIYFAIPTLGVLISGRKLTWKGWLLFLLIWPVGWMFMREELP